MAAEALSGLLARLRGPRAGAEGEDAGLPPPRRRRAIAILARNFRCRSGEVDVVAREGDVTVFVEVKERRGRSHGEGHESVTFGKRRRIVRAARLYAAVARAVRDARSASTWSRSSATPGGDRHPPRPRRVRRRRALDHLEEVGAGNGIRTRDFDLGKVALYH